MMNRTFSLLLALFLSLYGVGPMAADNRSQARGVFNNDVSAVPFRIPALAVTRDGRILAVCDYRISKTDIGYSNRNGLFQINEVMRTSADGGRTWSDSVVVARGNEHAAEEWRTAFGDPALVADRNSNEVLMSCVSGKAGYFAATRNHPQHAAFFRSLDGGRTWDKGTDLTEQIYGLYDSTMPGGEHPAGIFITSGNMMQSRKVKVGRYYRIYAAHPLRTAKVNKFATYVIYSDDFGRSWHVLGGAGVIPSDAADESKVEELPDGRVLLSCRNQGVGGRKFNVFTYKNVKAGTGTWGQDVVPELLSGKHVNACNGGTLLVRARRAADGRRVWLLLQTVPQTTQRVNVGFYYKELASRKDWVPAGALAKGWVKALCISDTTSCYSTLAPLKDGRIGILYEEKSYNEGYNILFRSLSLEEITEGKYR